MTENQQNNSVERDKGNYIGICKFLFSLSFLELVYCKNDGHSQIRVDDSLTCRKFIPPQKQKMAWQRLHWYCQQGNDIKKNWNDQKSMN